MAGGRRPSNYAPSTRTANQAATHSLHQLLSTGATQAFWPPSVWQPPDLANTPPPAPPPLSHPLPPPHRLPAASAPTPLPVTSVTSAQPLASAQLAHALDAAVQAAVIRALDFASSGGVLRTEDDATSSGSSSSPVHDDTLLARLRAATDANAKLLARINATDARSIVLERRVAALEAQAREVDIGRAADATRVDARVADAARRMSEAATSALQDHAQSVARANARAAADRARADRADRAERAARDHAAALSRRLDRADDARDAQVATLAAEFAALTTRMEGELRRADERSRDDARCASACDAQVAEMRQARDGAVEGLRTLRARLRKLEIAVDAQAKKGDESAILLDGAVENVRGEVRALKRLVESNLRAHSGAESVVKQQVSLITKHVCVAMRSYTSKKIEENNRELTERFLHLVSEARAEANGTPEGEKLAAATAATPCERAGEGDSGGS